MLGRFIASDRGFAKARKKGETLCRIGENYQPPDVAGARPRKVLAQGRGGRLRVLTMPPGTANYINLSRRLFRNAPQ